MLLSIGDCPGGNVNNGKIVGPKATWSNFLHVPQQENLSAKLYYMYILYLLGNTELWVLKLLQIGYVYCIISRISENVSACIDAFALRR